MSRARLIWGASPICTPATRGWTIQGVRAKFEMAWGVKLSDKKGITATEMTKAALDGSLRAMYIMGENPVVSDPHMSHTIEALRNLDFLVVQDIFLTETAALADVVLPAACFAEKDGTFTNTARMVQRVRKAVEPPGEARDDSAIITELSKRLGYEMGYESSKTFSRGRQTLAGSGRHYL